ncbi:hypothetical protein L1987_11067 [Smallanthus sonchifolius]|uniref:Uncharacterized protein n=1 Tax=Smallanthus sonchifolius TaxID=185202 RepID=A0ACB9JC51_9ASTR|nr:hypothetical protein L1987_11067 [Smallanthus sonchifolius]
MMICCSSRNNAYIPKLELFSRSKLDRIVKDPPLIQKSANDLADYVFRSNSYRYSTKIIDDFDPNVFIFLQPKSISSPPKPSLRGNNWVIDATHYQGCSSQFTFINRKV